MRIITTASEMTEFVTIQKNNGSTIGFVPTMGALHEGHSSLIRAAKKDNDTVVVSVFVNPTQFNQASDLASYPRTFDADQVILENECVDVMFFPSVNEVYPNSTKPTYDMDRLDQGMEGPNRPGHFNGVVQVVTRFFDLITPTSAYFGEKDFQQLAIIKYMIRKLGYTTTIIGCPTLREKNGLAMSSRNTRLTPEGKATASQISKALIKIKTSLINGAAIGDAVKIGIDKLTKNPAITLEYIEAVNSLTLKPATNEDSEIQVCIAAWIDGVRLIDNMRVK